MDVSELIGSGVMHISYGPGKIVSANNGRIQVQFTSGDIEKVLVYLYELDQRLATLLLEETVKKNQLPE